MGRPGSEAMQLVHEAAQLPFLQRKSFEQIREKVLPVYGSARVRIIHPRTRYQSLRTSMNRLGIAIASQSPERRQLLLQPVRQI